MPLSKGFSVRCRQQVQPTGAPHSGFRPFSAKIGAFPSGGGIRNILYYAMNLHPLANRFAEATI
jgi:hypothetical protein